MPTAPRRPCRKPGCHALHGNASGYCDTHQLAAKRERWDDDRGTASQRGYGAHWRKVRDAILRRYPLCQAEGCTQAATVVHHRDEDPGNNAADNLMAMCRACHERHHGRQAQGGGGGSKVHGIREKTGRAAVYAVCQN